MAALYSPPTKICIFSYHEVTCVILLYFLTIFSSVMLCYFMTTEYRRTCCQIYQRFDETVILLKINKNVVVVISN